MTFMTTQICTTDKFLIFFCTQKLETNVDIHEPHELNQIETINEMKGDEL